MKQATQRFLLSLAVKLTSNRGIGVMVAILIAATTISNVALANDPHPNDPNYHGEGPILPNVQIFIWIMSAVIKAMATVMK